MNKIYIWFNKLYCIQGRPQEFVRGGGIFITKTKNATTTLIHTNGNYHVFFKLYSHILI